MTWTIGSLVSYLRNHQYLSRTYNANVIQNTHVMCTCYRRMHVDPILTNLKTLSPIGMIPLIQLPAGVARAGCNVQDRKSA